MKITVNNYENLFRAIFEGDKTEFFLQKEDGEKVYLTYDYAAKAFVSEDYDSDYDENEDLVITADFILKAWELEDLEIISIDSTWGGYTMTFAAPATTDRTTVTC